MPSSEEEHHVCFIALGSNLGDRREHLRSALREVAEVEGVDEVGPVSAFHATEAVGPGSQPDYLNAAARVQTTLSARDFLASLLQIEQRHGRERSVRWGPRTLDLDLLLFDDAIIDEPGLSVPHPALHQRAFVLAPLSEIAPNVRHPRLGRTIAELLADLRTSP